MALVIVVAALLAAPALAGFNPEAELDSLAKEYPEFQRGLLRYGHHLRHGNSRHAALLKHAHNVHHRHHVSLDSELDGTLDDTTGEMPMSLPGRHPSVEKALDGMSGDLESLKGTKLAAKEARGQLEGTVTDAVHHMNDAMSIKHAIQKKESELRIESGKLQTLQADAGRLEQTRESLVTSLRRMLGPKVMFARERLEKKEAILHKEESAARAWKEKKDQLKASAMETIKQKKASHEALLEAEAEVAKAKKKEEMARIRYERDRSKTAEEVQSFRYAETRHNAELEHEKAARAAAAFAHESVDKLFNVEHVEQEKVDQSIMFRKDRLRQKMQEVEAARDKATQELNALTEEYRGWQEKQRERTAEVVKKSQETAAASEAYQAQQQQVLDTASHKVVRDAEGDDDSWGSWGSGDGMFTKVSRDQTDDDDDDDDGLEVRAA